MCQRTWGEIKKHFWLNRLHCRRERQFCEFPKFLLSYQKLSVRILLSADFFTRSFLFFCFVVVRLIIHLFTSKLTKCRGSVKLYGTTTFDRNAKSILIESNIVNKIKMYVNISLCTFVVHPFQTVCQHSMIFCKWLHEGRPKCLVNIS